MILIVSEVMGSRMWFMNIPPGFLGGSVALFQSGFGCGDYRKSVILECDVITGVRQLN